MGVVVGSGGFWLLFGLFERDARARVGFGALALGYIVAWYVPVLIKHRHIRAQNGLLGRCRALFILGARALDERDRASSVAILARIRRLEWIWRFGNSWAFRIALATWAVAWAVVACVAVRLMGLILMNQVIDGHAFTAGTIASDVQIAVIVSLTAPLYSILGYFEAWNEPWVVDDCGDRLHRLIFGPRSVSTKRRSGEAPSFDGMTPEQIFGLDRGFSRRELDRARRRLVKEFHPDVWHGASEQERAAREAAMKRVNAAYDLLRQRAR